MLNRGLDGVGVRAYCLFDWLHSPPIPHPPSALARPMVSALDTSSLGPRPWPGTLRYVLGQDTLLIVTVLTQVYKGVPVNLMLGITL